MAPEAVRESRMLQPSFSEGKEREVLSAAVENMHTLLGVWKGEWDKLEDVAEVVDGTMKLWVASAALRYNGEVTAEFGITAFHPPPLHGFITSCKILSYSISQHYLQSLGRISLWWFMGRGNGEAVEGVFHYY